MPCEQAKEFLRRHEVPFEEVHVEDLDDPMGELRALTGWAMATPTLVIDNEARVGFDPEWIRERLGID